MKSMKEKDYILFDLDGTLTDPVVGITKSVQYALSYYGIEVKDFRSLSYFIGPPLKDSFMEHYGFSLSQATEAIHIFREYFVPKGIYENEIYEGIEDLLEELVNAGKKLIVATSKPMELAEKVLEHFFIREYFDFVAGSTMEEERCKKEEVIAYALEKNHLRDFSRLVMIGDRKYDILGARALGIDSIGVLYGYGTAQELEKAGANWMAASIKELKQLLTG